MEGVGERFDWWADRSMYGLVNGSRPTDEWKYARIMDGWVNLKINGRMAG